MEKNMGPNHEYVTGGWSGRMDTVVQYRQWLGTHHVAVMWVMEESACNRGVEG
jgi:hypothetical protein